MTSAYDFTGLLDYFFPQRVVTIPAGMTNVTLNISLDDDQTSEVDEHFDLVIAVGSLISGILRGRLGRARITIVDDDHG